MRLRQVYIAYAVLGVALWPLPLLNVLHVESSAVVAAAAFFLSGWAATRSFSASTSPREAGRAALMLLLPAFVPAALLTVSVLWAPNCGYLQGAGLYLLFVPISAVLGAVVAYTLTATGWRHPFRWLVVIGLAVAAGGPIYDLGFHPQFFTYNHIFGGVLGPIYDEQLAIRPGLFWFRGMTVLWIVVLAALGSRLRGYGSARWTAVGVGAALALGAAYAGAPRLGVNVTEASLMEALPGTRMTEHFAIHYDPSAHDEAEVDAWARQQEFAYAQLAARLDVDPAAEERMLTFVYPSPDAKAALTGARTTSVAPVWLGRAQSHLLVARLEASFQHELAHLFARPFGLPGLRASWSVGLVEGWAVALEPPTLAPPPDDLVRAARGRTGLGEDLAAAVAARLSPFGFWTDRGAVSYTTMGSFVGYLLNSYGPERLKAVYATGNFREVYGPSVQSLAQAWGDSLAAAGPVHADAGGTAARWFSRPSIFETRCPHYVPPYRRQLQAADDRLSRDDTTAALRHLDEALRLEPRFATAHVRRARLRLAQGTAPDTVLAALDSLDAAWQTPAVDLVRADALALLDRPGEAADLYDRTVRALPPYRTQDRAVVWMRRLSVRDPELIRILVSGGEPRARAERFLAWGSSRTGDTGELPGGSREAAASALRATVWAAILFDAAHRPARSANLWASAFPVPSDAAKGNDRISRNGFSWTAMAQPLGADALPQAWQMALGEELFRRSLSAQSVAGRAAAVAPVAVAVADDLERRGAKTHAAVWRHLAKRAAWLREGGAAHVADSAHAQPAPRDELESTRIGG